MSYSRDSSNDLIWDPDSGQYVPTTAQYTLTINPTPSDATVVLTATGFTQDGNSIAVDENTTVAYTVSKTGYTTISGVVVVTQDQTLSIVLSRPVIQEVSISGTVYDIQSKSVVNKNTSNTTLTDVKFWVGTAQQYVDQQIETAHPEYLSGITDSVTTNTGFDIIDFQLPTSSNNYTWCKKYRNGWVEQGGIVSASSEQTIVVSLPQPMSDANYHITSSTIGFGDNYVSTQANTFELTVFNQTQTGFSMHIGGATNRNKRSWEVKGVAASN